jgi:hypothetical protein
MFRRALPAALLAIDWLIISVLRLWQPVVLLGAAVLAALALTLILHDHRNFRWRYALVLAFGAPLLAVPMFFLLLYAYMIHPVMGVALAVGLIVAAYYVNAPFMTRLQKGKINKL